MARGLVAVPIRGSGLEVSTSLRQGMQLMRLSGCAVVGEMKVDFSRIPVQGGGREINCGAELRLSGDLAGDLARAPPTMEFLLQPINM